MAATRIYSVKDKTGEEHLVEATSQAQAIRHVARGMFQIEVATAKEVATAMKAGAVVEDATQEPVAVE